MIDPTKECAIQSWEVQFIPGGWSIEIYIEGFRHLAEGRRPGDVVSRVQRILTEHKIPHTPEQVWIEANRQWVSRAPDRDLTKGQLSQITMSLPEFDFNSFMSTQTTPKEYGPKVWGMLDTFGMKHHWNQENWEAAVAHARNLLNPDKSPATGCAECHNSMELYVSASPPQTVRSPSVAAFWVFKLHDAVNRKLGKPIHTFVDMARKNHWVTE